MKPLSTVPGNENREPAAASQNGNGEEALATNARQPRLGSPSLTSAASPYGEVRQLPVSVRQEELVIPTYLPAAPDKNPMFLEKRVYQGSSGRVYPLPFTDRIAETKTGRKWKTVWLENEFLRVMILPEIGGRIHAIQDKTNGYDLIYNQRVIKPALVGLAGPWISGGIEFNWPQHHRPATFLPVDFEIRRSTPTAPRRSGASDHDPMSPDERHARRLPAPGQKLCRTESPRSQPHAVRADVSLVGERGGARTRSVSELFPAGRLLRCRPRPSFHE